VNTTAETAATTPAPTVAAATPVGTPGATPVGSPAATPVVAVEAPPTVDPLAANLEEAATAVAGCLSDGNYDTLNTMTSDLYRGQLFGTSSPLDAATFAELAPMLPQVAYQILSVEDATASDTTATALVTYEMAHQVRTSTWEFTQKEVGGETVWILNSETPAALTVPAGTPSLAVQIKGNAYTLPKNAVDGPAVALQATNADKVDHELLVLRFDQGVTTKTLLESSGPTFPEGVHFIGQATVPAGSDGTLLLAGLQPGSYTIVCLLPDANGTPYLVNGMETTFTVK